MTLKDIIFFLIMTKEIKTKKRKPQGRFHVPKSLPVVNTRVDRVVEYHVIAIGVK